MQKSWYKGKYRKKFMRAKWRTKVGFSNSHLALSLELGKPTEHPQPAWTSPNHTHLANHSEILNITSHSSPFEISMLTATSRTYLTNILWVRGPIVWYSQVYPIHSICSGNNHFYLNLDLSTICHEVFLLGWNSPWATFGRRLIESTPNCISHLCLHRKKIEILQGLVTNCVLGGSPPIYVGAREMETRFEVGLGITRNLLQRR